MQKVEYGIAAICGFFLGAGIATVPGLIFRWPVETAFWCGLPGALLGILLARAIHKRNRRGLF